MDSLTQHAGTPTKPFALTPVKSPEEVAIEERRRAAPSLRRAVNQLDVSTGAKFLFAALTDDSFLHAFGGNGAGKVFTTARELSHRYGHDRDSIMRWRNELLERGVLWCRDLRRCSEWRITGICPAPASKWAAEEFQVEGMASREEEKLVRQDADLTHEKNFASISAGNHPVGGKEPHDVRHPAALTAASSGHSGGRMPPERGQTPATRAAGCRSLRGDSGSFEL